MRYLTVIGLFVFIICLMIVFPQIQTFVPSEDVIVPTRSSGPGRTSRYGSKFYPTAPNATPVSEVVIPSDFYQGNQMPTDLDGPYWPSTVLPGNVPDYAYRVRK